MDTVPIRILLIEDNPGDARLIAETLREAGAARFRLIHVPTLQEARRHLGAADVDIVLSDLTLPDGSGLETVRRVHEMSGGVPLVVLTGVEDEALAVKAMQVGAQDYLVKGQSDSHLLVRSIRHAIERSRILGELQGLNVRMERLALVDPLTELLNRRGLERALAHETERARRSGTEIVVLLVDLDDFKGVNDALGHAVGDVVLKEVAQALRKCLRPTDPVARIGGDEFMVLLPDTRLAEGIKTAERVRLAASSSLLEVTSNVVKVTASVGAAVVPRDDPTIDELLSQTHLALRRCKRSGKNRVCTLEAGGSDGDPIGELLDAMKGEDGFTVVSQPVLKLGDGSVVGREFLSRGPHGPLHMPVDFFRFSYENNILTMIDRRCLRKCLAAAAAAPDAGRSHINLFPSTLLDIPIPQLIEMFPSNGNAGRYCVEISEQQIIGDPSYLVEPVVALRERGVRIAIDDVGFGRSCLESLILLLPDVIKIDRRCVHGVGSDPAQARLLQRLLRVAEALKAEVVAEGIETQEDLEMLRRLGVPYGQGFLWGQPA